MSEVTVRERRRGFAPDPGRLLLVPGRAWRFEERLQEVGGPHTLAHSSRSPFARPCLDRHRPRHAARGLPAAARKRPRVVPARVGRPGPARAAFVRRLRHPARLVRRGRDDRRTRGRLPRLRPRCDARTDGGAAGRGAGRAREPVRRRRRLPALRSRHGNGGRPARRRRRDRGHAQAAGRPSPTSRSPHTASRRAGPIAPSTSDACAVRRS